MEQIQQPLPHEQERRVALFAQFLGGVTNLQDLFNGDDGLSGDREPRRPGPTHPPTAATNEYREYFAPVYELFPKNPVKDIGRRTLQLVHSS